MGGCVTDAVARIRSRRPLLSCMPKGEFPQARLLVRLPRAENRKGTDRPAGPSSCEGHEAALRGWLGAPANASTDGCGGSTSRLLRERRPPIRGGKLVKGTCSTARWSGRTVLIG